MMNEYIFAGFGGQGMLLIGKFLAMACMMDGKHVSWLPSYGPEMRGGTANCSVIVSDKPVASPLVDKADVVIAMNRPSLDKFESHVKPGGTLVINSSIIDRKAERTDINVVYCDANKIAEEVGNPKGANVAILGALLQKSPVCLGGYHGGSHPRSSWASARRSSWRATRRPLWPAWKPQSNPLLFS
jgi:2-oxoglutarate ferredoxin oxidoreductase subunit gamma